MATDALADVLRYLRCLAGDKQGDAEGDGQLLERFVSRREEAVFAALLQRHAPLVLRVCRQVLGNSHDAEDAFQATFLVLAKKADSVRRHASLAAWLHRVALNIARTARTRAALRRAHERQAALMATANPTDGAAPGDWQSLVHQEVDRLPHKYRVPVVLCYLEGKTHDQAARQLGWPPGTVKGRLARARDLLRTRLARRGLALTAAGVAAALAGGAAAAVVPPALLARTLRAAVSFAGGGAAGASAPALALAKGTLRTMTATKLVRLLVLLLAVGAVSFGAALARGLGPDAAVPGDPPAAQEVAPLADAFPGEAPLAVQPAHEEEPPKPPRREAVNGLRLTLRLNKSETRLKADGRDIEPVDLRIAYANVSDRPIKLDLTVATVLCSTRLEVSGPGVVKFADKRPPLEPDKLTPEDYRVLKPGEEWGIDLPFPVYVFFWDLFTVKQPGDYRIRMVYSLLRETDSPLAKGSWTGTVTSNEVALTVLPADGFGDEVKGLRARVTLAKEKFEVGEAVPVKYVVKNVSKDEQTLWHSGFWPHHQIIVKDADGKEPPLTEYGKERRKSFSPGGERGKNVPVKVPAGGEDAAYEQYDLAGLYDLSKPGRYKVQYVYEEKQGGWEGRLPSNEAAFEVVPAGKKEGVGKEESKFQGLWLATELNGSGIVTRDAKEFRVLIEGDKITWEGKGEKREYRFKLDPSPPEKKIDLFPTGGEGRGQPWLGIYSAAEDRLTLSFYKDASKGRPPASTAKADVGLWGLECRHVLESKAVRVDGLEFVALAPVGVGPAPVGGIRDRTDLALRVTNVSDKPLALGTFDVIRPRLYTADGKELRMDGGRDGLPKATPPAMLAPGASWTWRAEANLRWMKDRNTLQLDGPDGRGVAGFWSFPVGKEGKFRFAVEYANSNAKQGDVALWVGKGTTEQVDFEIVFRAEPLVEHARHGALKALQDEYEKLRKKYADQGKVLPEHKGDWIPIEAASYHMRKVTERPDVVHVKFWTAVEGGFGYEAEVEVNRRTSEVRVLRASVSYSQE
jgi:RNA polymerase sigma factor (sigma-70 family)